MVTSADSVTQSKILPDSNITPKFKENEANVLRMEMMWPNKNTTPFLSTPDSDENADVYRIEKIIPPFSLSTTEVQDVTMMVMVNGVACACIRIYSPVCGTDNKSYFNPCLLACEHGNEKPNVTVQYDGNCIPW